MSREQRLQQLLKNPRVWRNKPTQGGARTLATGFAVLDQRLNGGWPIGVLTELLIEEEGAGELSLLMPALAAISQPADGNRGDWTAWIAPPHIPYPPALAQHGIDVSRVLVAHSESPDDALWAIEQALRSAACGAVLGWISRADDRSLRRLQLAAETGQCWTVVFRHSRFAQAASPAPLRIAVDAGQAGIQLNFLRNRYGLPGVLNVPC